MLSECQMVTLLECNIYLYQVNYTSVILWLTMEVFDVTASEPTYTYEAQLRVQTKYELCNIPNVMR